MKHDHKYLTIILALIFSFSSLTLVAQFDPAMSLPSVAGFYYNPSMAGSEDATRLSFVGRDQWIGITDAPLTFFAGWDQPVEKLKGDIGAFLMYEKLGPFNIARYGLGYGYRIYLNENVYLKPSLQARYNFTRLYEPTYPLDKTVFSFDFVYGLSAQLKNFTFGASLAHYPELFISKDRILRREMLAVHSGYKYVPAGSGDWDLQLYAQAMFNGPLRLYQGYALWRYKPVIIGVGYEHQNSVNATIGVKIKEHRIMCTYSYITSMLGTTTNGTFELGANIVLPKK